MRNRMKLYEVNFIYKGKNHCLKFASTNKKGSLDNFADASRAIKRAGFNTDECEYSLENISYCLN